MSGVTSKGGADNGPDDSAGRLPGVPASELRHTNLDNLALAQQSIPAPQSLENSQAIPAWQCAPPDTAAL